jgi:DNA adenine methylase
MKPLLKWVGGKTKLIPYITKYMPHEFSNYVESFTGGGALFFNLPVSKGVINDVNPELVNFYRTVRNYPKELFDQIKDFELDEESYYKIRSIDRQLGWQDKLSDIRRASRFLYLNRTSFNGMWRENKSGHMNVPYGFYDSYSWPTLEVLINASNKLKNFEINNGDFDSTFKYITKDSFVYLDPPYIPYSGTSDFTGYSANGFSIEDQERLVSFCDKIDALGAKFMVSNSDTELTRDLYKNYEIVSVSVYHSVGAKSEARNKRGEVLVRNFNCDNTFLSLL